MRQIAVANREARARWILAYVGGNALRRSREVPQPYDRHTQGTYWHMREDTLAYNHGHARAYRGHARAYRGHARAREDTHAHARTRSRTETPRILERRGCEPSRASPRAGTLFAHRPGTFTQPNLSSSSVLVVFDSPTFAVRVICLRGMVTLYGPHSRLAGP